MLKCIVIELYVSFFYLGGNSEIYEWKQLRFIWCNSLDWLRLKILLDSARVPTAILNHHFLPIFANQFSPRFVSMYQMKVMDLIQSRILCNFVQSP